MAVRNAASANSRGELAPVPNPFVQPGTDYAQRNPDTAMTDGIKHAMLKAQLRHRSALLSPWQVRRHLQQHHGIRETESPLTEHASKHTLDQLTQGHSLNADDQLFHGSTDIGAGTANFANEAPPMIALTRRVRTARGVYLFKEPIGTPITEGQYLGAKQSEATAREMKEQTEQSAFRERNILQREASLSHADLLSARSNARSKYPVGHPERIAAEQAVRSSRRTVAYRNTRTTQAHVSNTKKRQDAAKDPAFYTPTSSAHLLTGGAPTSAATSTTGGSISKATPSLPDDSQLRSRLSQIASLSDAERSRYYAMRQAGIMHDTAMQNIAVQRSRPVAKTKAVTQLKQRKRG